MPIYTDQLGRQVVVRAIPHRIVSLVPSITELLYSLQLEDRVAGITKFCVHPNHWFRQKTRIGGTKTVRADIIDKLQPDLIIANKEENIKEQVAALAGRYPVWVSDVNTLADALEMIAGIGAVTNTPARAQVIQHDITRAFNQLAATVTAGNRPPVRTAYLIWREPYMTIGNDTFIHDLLTRCGLHNVFASHTRYPAITVEQLQHANCQLLLLSSEPYPFAQKHINELQPALPDTQIVLANGEYFSWYGSRLLHAPDYFTQLLNSTFAAD
jgi:ABC-type Fe3+-hydroxamate transport system substrate-binding protein